MVNWEIIVYCIFTGNLGCKLEKLYEQEVQILLVHAEAADRKSERND